MLDRPALDDAPLAAASPRPRWPLAFAGAAGLLGAAGVGVGAAGAHLGGGDLTRTASEFLLVHAAALLGAAGLASASPWGGGWLVPPMLSLTVGAALFGGELAGAGLLDWRPIPLAAPVGGLCLIAGWLGIPVAALIRTLRVR